MRERHSYGRQRYCIWVDGVAYNRHCHYAPHDDQNSNQYRTGRKTSCSLQSEQSFRSGIDGEKWRGEVSVWKEQLLYSWYARSNRVITANGKGIPGVSKVIKTKTQKKNLESISKISNRIRIDMICDMLYINKEKFIEKISGLEFESEYKIEGEFLIIESQDKKN